jgi:hypothetical protein
MSNTINFGKIYESSNFGNGVTDNTINWGKIYVDLVSGVPAILKDLQARATYFENETGSTTILKKLEACKILSKASIVITPTAYEDGKILAGVPKKSLSAEKVLNGDYSNGFTSWIASPDWSIVNNKASITNANGGFSNSSLRQDNILITGRKYTIEIKTDSVNGVLNFFSVGSKDEYDIITGTNTFDFISDGTRIVLVARSGCSAVITSVSIKEIIDADLDFTRGSGATRTNASSNIVSSQGNNTSRIDYTGGVGHILLEGQTTNLIEFSNNFNDDSYNKFRVSIDSNSLISPEGINNASFLKEDLTNTTHLLRYVQAVSSQSLCFSVFAKKNTNNRNIEIDCGSNDINAVFNLNLGTIISQHNSNPKITSIGNDWFLCSVSRGLVVGEDYFQIRLMKNNELSYLGDGASGVYIFGAQLSTKLATYVPTNGTAQTRLAETASKSGLGALLSGNGTLYIDAKSLDNDSTIRTLSFFSNNAEVNFKFNSTANEVIMSLSDVSGVTVSRTLILPNALNFNKYAFQFKTGGSSFYVNGSVNGVEDTTSFDIPIGELTNFAFTDSSGNQNSVGGYKTIAWIPEDLTATELQCITTI